MLLFYFVLFFLFFTVPGIGIIFPHPTRFHLHSSVHLSVQLNIKLLIVSIWQRLPYAIFICLEKIMRLWEIKLWILVSLSISCVRCCSFAFSKTQNGPRDGSPLQGITAALQVEGQAELSQFPSEEVVNWALLREGLIASLTMRRTHIFLNLWTLQGQQEHKSTKKCVCT